MLLAVKSYHTDSAGQAVRQDSQDVVAVVRACRDKPRQATIQAFEQPKKQHE